MLPPVLSISTLWSVGEGFVELPALGQDARDALDGVVLFRAAELLGGIDDRVIGGERAGVVVEVAFAVGGEGLADAVARARLARQLQRVGQVGLGFLAGLGDRVGAAAAEVAVAALSRRARRRCLRRRIAR